MFIQHFKSLDQKQRKQNKIHQGVTQGYLCKKVLVNFQPRHNKFNKSST